MFFFWIKDLQLTVRKATDMNQRKQSEAVLIKVEIVTTNYFPIRREDMTSLKHPIYKFPPKKQI